MATTIGSLDLNAFNDLYSDSNQYFWFESNASATYGAGAHVTLVPDTSFISNPTGQNILMNTDGFSIRNGLLPMMTLDNDSLDFNVVDTTAGTYTTTATFTATGARIGQSSGAHSVIDANGQRFYAIDGTTQLANLGYGEGTNSTGGVSTAPYYTVGTRLSTNVNYDKTKTYSVGDIVVHNEKIYVCKVLVFSPEEWDSNNWDYYIGNYSQAEGDQTLASGSKSHSEGYYTKAIGYASHAEGMYTIANMNMSHAEGYSSKAIGQHSHAEGKTTEASGFNSHAEGMDTVAHGNNTHAQNLGTYARGRSQTVIGEYNYHDYDATTTYQRGKYALIVGNGNADNNRSNALTVDWSGNVNIASGALYHVNGAPISDFVVEQGTSGNWSYRKYNSGIYEAWYTGTNTFAIDGRFASNSPVLWYGATQNLSLPFAVTSIQYVDVKALYSNWGVWTAITQADSGGIKYQAFSALARTSATYAIRGYIKGTYSLT